ncbi:methyl-accepting chemotaxis sensory transducer [Stanieria cyanosphaera PCC 7437]|uniref:Methyl-accepting chemotaxis sensory transducer n=1 Tax=Stanieria cyanosphaera (strain ATCC 29371 / PCC 7437) TaxID=111780 RepID=K9Y1M4_STAC7|nr:methyl-accepting chemotaxis protein [Stanieria cyanosphaera]AFZ37892.1 methyl-accepting chemotaxis sensory transducer [Stanieria cyanosphaera PCC 7437]
MVNQHNNFLSLSEQPKFSFLFNNLVQRWNNLKFSNKLILMLIGSITLPIISITQINIWNAQKLAVQDLEKVLQLELKFLNQTISVEQNNIAKNAIILDKTVEQSEINLNQIEKQTTELNKLNQIIASVKELDPNRSFYLITDAQGKTVAQYIQIIDEDFSTYSSLPSEEKSLITKFRSVSPSTGIKLDELPIVKQTLNQKRSLSGLELLPEKLLQQLGLAEQANIGLRQQKIEGLPEAKKPFPEETYNTEQGKTGFVMLAVEPIQVNNQLIGTAIVGTLLNRNYELVDRLKQNTGVSTATIFAQDWRVSTNVPYTDKQTRAIGTRVSREVADRVLNQTQDFLGAANIIGIDYITGYSPLYDHQKLLNPQQAKPVGIAYVGEPKTELNQRLMNIALTGYGVAGTILLLITIILIPITKSFSDSLQRLAKFVQRVSSGEQGLRLNNIQRQDEIGILSQEINAMIINLENSREQEQLLAQSRQQQAETERENQKQQNEALQQELLQFITDIEGVSDGNLTVRANITEGAIGIAADFFNSIIESLRDIVTRVQEATNNVNTSVSVNEDAIRQVTEETIQQTHQINETLNSVAEMTRSIQVVANSAQQAAEVSRDASTSATIGGEAIEQTVQSILQLRETVAATAKKVKRLGESSQEISKVVSLINQIAMQTNLLAINASIEASRAGEEGRGFAVVAEEVGELATKSAEATKEIEEIVESIQEETAEVVAAMEIGTAQVVEGTRLVENTKQSLEQIVQVSRQIDELLQSISSATVSQVQTSQTVTQLMEKIAEISQRTSSASNNVSSSLEETVKIAQQLQASVGTFKV